MNKLINSNRVVFLAAGVVVGFVLLFGGMLLFNNKSVANAKDVVKDFKPVSERFYTPNYAKAMEELKNLPGDQRAAYLAKNFPKLENDIIFYLKDRGKLTAEQKVTNVEFLFGSAKDGVVSEDGDGNQNTGGFKDQLLAKLTIEGEAAPKTVIVNCLNGTFALPGDLQSLGIREVKTKCVIGKAQGLTACFSMETSLDLAQRFSLQLFEGRRMTNSNKISVEQAAQINTDTKQVTVKVYEGDEFDLQNMTYTPAPRK